MDPCAPGVLREPRSRPSRAVWGAILTTAYQVARAVQLDPDQPLSGPATAILVLSLRADLKGAALMQFAVEGESAERARMAFVFQARAMLDAGLPRTRLRLARGLTVLATELDGLLADAAAAETQESLRRAGAGD